MKTSETHYPKHYHIGLLKTGSTTIQEVLGSDPRIQLLKHTRFFNTLRGLSDRYPWIDQNRLPVESDENISWDSRSLLGLDFSLRRIKEVRPDAVIILVLREQRSWILSGWKYHVFSSGETSRSLDDFLSGPVGSAYIRVALYDELLDRIRSVFPMNQVRILLFEQLTTDFDQFLRSFYACLGMLPPPTAQYLRANSSRDLAHTVLRATCLQRPFFDYRQPLGRIETKLRHGAADLLHRWRSSAAQQVPLSRIWSSDVARRLLPKLSASNRRLQEVIGVRLQDSGYLLE